MRTERVPQDVNPRLDVRPPDDGRRTVGRRYQEAGRERPSWAAGKPPAAVLRGSLTPRLLFAWAIWRRRTTPPAARLSWLQVRRDEALLRILPLPTPVT